MEKKYLFISQSDLSLEDSNGRTLRDVFNYINWDKIYTFSTSRKNNQLNASQTFCINEKLLFKRKKIHRNVSNSSNKISPSKPIKIKKNPLTVFLRGILWSLSFLHWKHNYKKWLKEINVDYIVFNPGDFIFMHKIAVFSSKITQKKLIIYNTEDYYFKTWNYLHDERGFKRLYPLFRKHLVRSYNITFKYTNVAFHNTENLCDVFKTAFPDVKHFVAYHPTFLKINKKTKTIKSISSFYYSGALDKGRDKTLLLFANILKDILPSFKIIVNGLASESVIENIMRADNIIYNGVVPYEKVVNILKQNTFLLSINSLEKYLAKDKILGFSTKIADYISSLNLIFHIGVEGGVELNTIKKYKLGYVSSTKEQIIHNLNSIVDNLKECVNPFLENQKKFTDKYLDYKKVGNMVKEIVENNERK